MDAEAQVNRSLMPLRTIVVAMMMGVLAFGVVVLAIGPQGLLDGVVTQVLLLALVGMGVAEFVAFMVLRGALVGKLRGELEGADPDADLAVLAVPTLTTLTLIGAAMAEGFGLFGGVVYLVAGARPALAAPVIALALLVTKIPSREKLDNLVAAAKGRQAY